MIENICNGMVVMNRTTTAPNTVLLYDLDKGYVLQSVILFLNFPVLKFPQSKNSQGSANPFLQGTHHHSRLQRI